MRRRLLNEMTETKSGQISQYKDKGKLMQCTNEIASNKPSVFGTAILSNT